MTECPRWRLLAPHYLNIAQLPDGTKVEWEHKETNRESGRAIRKLFPVPMFLDPESPGDHNYPGEIIVTHEVDGGHPMRNDLVMFGPPTRDMEPLNEAAEQESDKHRARWINPVETLPANGGMNQDEMAFFKTMMAQFATAAQVPQVDNTSVPREAYDDLKARLAKLEAIIAAQNKAPDPAPQRRV